MKQLVINTKNRKNKINKEIYGHFAEHLGRCIYEGIFVGKDSDIPNVNGIRKDVVEALKEMALPVLRWPGGCFADEYHWKDGIGELNSRKRMINTHWGGVVEDNSFGTHEFMELCAQLDCEPYINGNLGSGTVQEMSEWVEYLTFEGISPMAELRSKNGREKAWKVKYFGVGNENWGCGGNMTPQYYANEYRRYQTYLRNYGENKLYKIACGSSGIDYEWTDELMRTAGKYMDGLSLHHYTLVGSWEHKGSATDFDTLDWYKALKNAMLMEELIRRHSGIMDKYDPEKRVGLIIDEWGCWHDVEVGTNRGFLYQQNTMRDALVAAITLNIFNKHCDRVKMANLAQLVNVLQAVILTEGNKMLLTPTYHVFKMYKGHQEATLVDSYIEKEKVGLEEIMVDNLSESASVDQAGVLHVTVANLSHDKDYEVNTVVFGKEIDRIKAEIVTGEMRAHNTFDDPNKISLREFTEFKITTDGIRFTIPKGSIISFHME